MKLDVVMVTSNQKLQVSDQIKGKGTKNLRRLTIVVSRELAYAIDPIREAYMIHDAVTTMLI